MRLQAPCRRALNAAAVDGKDGWMGKGETPRVLDVETDAEGKTQFRHPLLGSLPRL